MRFRSTLAALLLTALGATTRPAVPLPPQPAAAPGTFAWCNPIDLRLRDPQLLRIGDRYFVTGTAPPFFESLGQAPGVPLWESADLIHWTADGILVAPSKDHWFKQRFWAPEIFHDLEDGKFYCTFNCPGGPLPKAPQSVGLAVADAIRGPYTVLTVDAPLCVGNDATIFRDRDGKTYLFVSGVSMAPVDLPHAKLLAELTGCFAGGTPGDWETASPLAPAVGHEGPSLFERDGTIYCFYSSWGRGYEVGYATAKSPAGPWTKYARNPVYGAQDAAWCKQYKHVFTQEASIPWRQVGHCSIFTGPDSRPWIAAHGYRRGDSVLQPHLCLDPLDFADGAFSPTPVSFTPQSVRRDGGVP